MPRFGGAFFVLSVDANRLPTMAWITTVSDPDSLMERVLMRAVEVESGCWQWQGIFDRSGYGKIKVDNRTTGPHRAIWLAMRGDIPDGLVIDHLCRNRACVNPDHMELVTGRVNTQRGELKGRSGRRRGTHTGCGKHQFTDGYFRENRKGYTYWTCRPCADDRRRRWRDGQERKPAGQSDVAM